MKSIAFVRFYGVIPEELFRKYSVTSYRSIGSALFEVTAEVASPDMIIMNADSDEAREYPLFIERIKRRNPGTMSCVYRMGKRISAKKYGADCSLPKSYNFDELSDFVTSQIGE